MRFLTAMYTGESQEKELAGDTWKKDTSNYKRCLISNNSNLPFQRQTDIYSFDDRVKLHYESVLSDMEKFVSTFLENQKNVKMQWLCAALLELIDEDATVKGAKFLLGHNQEKFCIEYFEKHGVYLPAFLLAVFHFIIMERTDNRIGRHTYKSWFEDPGSNAQKYFVSDIGRKWENSIRLISKDAFLSSSDLLRDSSRLYFPISAEETKKSGGHGAFLNQDVNTNQTNLKPSEDAKALSQKYYSLFVTECIDEDKHWFVIQLDKALTEYTSSRVAKLFDLEDENGINNIRTVPSLIIRKGMPYKGRTNINQRAIFGYIVSLRIDFNELIFEYREMNRVPLQSIVGIANQIGLEASRKAGELNKCHWAVKEADLIRILDENSIKWSQ